MFYYGYICELNYWNHASKAPHNISNPDRPFTGRDGYNHSAQTEGSLPRDSRGPKQGDAKEGDLMCKKHRYRLQYGKQGSLLPPDPGGGVRICDVRCANSQNARHRIVPALRSGSPFSLTVQKDFSTPTLNYSEIRCFFNPPETQVFISPFSSEYTR